MEEKTDDTQECVILFFPDGLDGEKFVDSETKYLCYEGQLKPSNMIELYVDEVGWKPCYVVALFASQEELIRNFSRETEIFYRNFQQTKFVILYFPDNPKQGKFPFECFDEKNLKYKPKLEASKWIEIYDPEKGWRLCFVLSIYNSEEEMTKNFTKETEMFSKLIEYATACYKSENFDTKSLDSTAVACPNISPQNSGTECHGIETLWTQNYSANSKFNVDSMDEVSDNNQRVTKHKIRRAIRRTLSHAKFWKKTK